MTMDEQVPQVRSVRECIRSFTSLAVEKTHRQREDWAEASYRVQAQHNQKERASSWPIVD